MKVAVYGHTLHYGKPFTTPNLVPLGLASSEVRAAIDYSVDRQYTENNPFEAPWAIWH